MLEYKGELIMARALFLLRPLFTLCFIERINKALGSGATFSAPLMLMVTLITFLAKKKKKK